MDRLIDSSCVPPGEVAHIGIAIREGGLHIGVLYRVTAKRPALLLEVAWHNKLCSSLPTAAYVLWVDPLIPEDRAKAVAAFCRRVWKQNEANGVPYGFSEPNDFFDHSGDILRGPAKVGLTCASFVLAVFDTAGLPLIQYEQWPHPTDEDIARQGQFLRQLEEDERVPQEHIRAVQGEMEERPIRYRPLQVAGAATNDSLPSDHAYASRLATRIKRRLKILRVSGP